MTKLVELCEKNLPVAVEITHALVEAQRNALRRIWPKISEVGQERLGESSQALSRKTKGLDAGPKRIENMLMRLEMSPDWHGLFWPLSPASKDGSDRLARAPALGVEINTDGLIFGVRCQDDRWKTIRDALRDLRTPENQANDWWPCRIVYEGGRSNGRTWAQLATLANDEDERTRCAGHIADTLLKIREELQRKTSGLFD